jgi:NADPH:quinone reductase-like Zn-dependent oxidoreductase
MKAMVFTQYGTPDVLQYTDVAKPTPKDDEVLVKVHAASLNKADYYFVSGSPFPIRLMTGGLFKPVRIIPGSDVAGVVEAVGKSATQFKVGDAVFGDLTESGWGTFAEYACARESALAHKPANISFEDAAAVPMAGVTALQGLRDKGGIQRGQRVLVNGASGGVGTFALQIAKALGAHVTAVTSPRNVEAARALGADHVIDYTQEDFTQSGQQYDLIAAVNGYHPLAHYKRALKAGGRYVMLGGTNAQISEALLLAPFYSTGGVKMGNLMAKPKQSDLAFLAGLLEAGSIKPVIDRCYPLRQLADALRYVGDGHARGKVVITM